VWPHDKDPKPVVVPEAKVTIWSILVKENYLVDKKNQFTWKLQFPILRSKMLCEDPDLEPFGER
jgi:hypothetical protein